MSADKPVLRCISRHGASTVTGAAKQYKTRLLQRIVSCVRPHGSRNIHVIRGTGIMTCRTASANCIPAGSLHKLNVRAESLPKTMPKSFSPRFRRVFRMLAWPESDTLHQLKACIAWWQVLTLTKTCCRASFMVPSSCGALADFIGIRAALCDPCKTVIETIKTQNLKQKATI